MGTLSLNTGALVLSPEYRTASNHPPRSVQNKAVHRRMGQSSSSPSPGVLYQPVHDQFSLLSAAVPSLGLTITSSKSRDGDLSFSVPVEFISQRPTRGDATLKLKLAPGQAITFDMLPRDDIKRLSFVTAETFDEIESLVSKGDLETVSIFL
jgi:hypothetical protein